MDRDFKGVWIPKEVWLDTRLNSLDKVILSEIDSLDKGEDGCWASNQYIADFCQCSQTKVSTSITKLVKLNYLYVQSFNGRQRKLKSRLSNFERQTNKNCKADLQNLKETNIKNNLTTNTKRDIFTPPTLEDVEAYCKERRNGIDPERFIDYYQQQKWKLSNGNPMSDWKAAVRTWEHRNKKPKRSELDEKILEMISDENYIPF